MRIIGGLPNQLSCLRNFNKIKFSFNNGLSNYGVAEILPIPHNIDVAETTRFSPNRTRDISATVILSQHVQPDWSNIDITTDNSSQIGGSTGNYERQDPHVQSYDCFGAVNLNSAMQSNVPTPFGGMHKFSHLNMPGGQWSQESKFTSHNLHSSHYITLRKTSRSNWLLYDQDATVKKDAATLTKELYVSPKMCKISNGLQTQFNRGYCSTAKPDKESKVISKKEQLKKAFKDYGATIVIFHVSLSLVSLGCCYLLVSSGIDMMSVCEQLGITSGSVPNGIATGASTFVISYAIHKIFAPVRISLTLGATPLIVRYMRAKGYIKPPKK